MMAFALSFSMYTAQAAEFGLYVTPKIGYNLQSKDSAKISGNASSGLSSDLSSSLSGGIAIGYDMQYSESALPLRFEFEAMFRTKTSADNKWTDAAINYNATQDMRMDTYFVNAYFDIYNSSPFVPYLSAGLGMMDYSQTTKINDVSFSSSDAVFAANVGLGISWLIKGGFMVDLGYRFIYLSEISASQNDFKSTIRPTTHELLFGLRYTF